MSKKAIGGMAIFAAGAAVGAFGSWQFTRKKNEQYISEEISKAREVLTAMKDQEVARVKVFPAEKTNDRFAIRMECEVPKEELSDVRPSLLEKLSDVRPSRSCNEYEEMLAEHEAFREQRSKVFPAEKTNDRFAIREELRGWVTGPMAEEIDEDTFASISCDDAVYLKEHLTYWTDLGVYMDEEDLPVVTPDAFVLGPFDANFFDRTGCVYIRDHALKIDFEIDCRQEPEGLI